MLPKGCQRVGVAQATAGQLSLAGIHFTQKALGAFVSFFGELVSDSVTAFRFSVNQG
jgi:hypothetical protein